MALEMRSLGLPGSPGGGAWSLFPREPLEYTLILPFQAGFDLLNAGDPALYLKHIGQQWAVYLNGTLIRNEFIRSRGAYLERSLRDVIVPIDKRHLVRGDNVLAFRLRGDPVDDRTGFNRAGPYGIGSYRVLSEGNREYLDLMLIGIFAFFALYHCALFAMRPRDTSNLFFGTSTLLVALYLWARSGTATSFLSNTAVLRRIEYSALFLTLPSIVAFLESILAARRSRVSRLLAAACAFMVALGFFLRLESLLYAWYALAIPGIVYVLVPVVGSALVAEYRSQRAVGAGGNDQGTSEAKGERLGRLAALVRTVVLSAPGRVAIACLALGLAVVLDIWLVAAAGGSVSFTGFAFLVFVLLVATIPAKRFSAMRTEVEAMNLDLEAAVEARTASLAATAADRLRLNQELSETSETLAAIVKESERDMRAAAAVQRGFYATRPPKDAAWDIASVFEPLTGVSADFYDFYEHGETLSGLSLGTVSGEGVASGLLTVLVRNIMARGFGDATDSALGEALDAVNRTLARELSASGSTVSCVTFRLDGAGVTYAIAGRSPLFVRRALGAEVEALGGLPGSAETAPLGRDDFVPSPMELRLGRGEALLACSGGLLAGVDAKGEAYGVERLAQAFRRADDDSAESLLTSVMLDFKNSVPRAGRRADIAAIVLVRR